MTILAIVIAAIALVWYLAVRAGKSSFWKTVSRSPNEAYEWFRTEDCWVVVDPADPSSRPPNPRQTYSGPFRLSVPKLGGRVITIYGRTDEITDSQDRFLRKHNEHIGAVRRC